MVNDHITDAVDPWLEGYKLAAVVSSEHDDSMDQREWKSANQWSFWTFFKGHL
jgi:hypothetical protein